MWPSNWGICVVLAFATISSAQDTLSSRDCGDDPCLNGGDCYFDYEMEEEEGDRFFCVCVEPYYGKTCENMKIPTTSEPIETTTTFVSTLTTNKYRLTTEAPTWDRVTDDTGTVISRDCGDDPCLNGGDCYFDYEMEEEEGDRFFCVCVEPFYGKTCEKTKLSTSREPDETTTTFLDLTTANDPCSGNPCRNGGFCQVQGSTFKCFCPSPFTGRTCSSGPCSHSPCQNEGICAVHGDSHICSCKPPFTGKNCEITPCSNNPCKNDGVCEIFGNTFKCSCKAPFFGLRCEEDACSNNACKNGGVCKATDNGYKCYCSPPFTGSHCEKSPCSNSPCKNGGICAVHGDSHVCSCKHPFSGKNCEITPCSNNPCENGGVCKIVGSTFECSCKAPFFGLRCEEDACSKNPCRNGGMCKATDNGYKCFCSSPFMGSHCEKTPCSGSPCENSGICSVEEDNFKCSCLSPYSGKSCEIGPCTVNPCMNEGMCEVHGNSFECYCKKPYYGERCQKDPCTPNPCRNDGTCEINGSSFTCTCKEPFIGELCGEMVTTATELEETTVGTTPKPGACSNNPCKNGGMCKATDYGYNCYCLSPFTGAHCEKSPCSGSPCENNGTCAVEGDDYRCYCQPPYSGKSCEIGPCTVNPCMNGGKCQVRGDSFECYCKKPYQGETCQKDPCTSNPCQNDGTCEVNGASFTCTCKEPFTGELCGEILTTSTSQPTELEITTVVTTNPDPCSLNPCWNGGTCRLTEDSYVCDCPEGYFGRQCQTACSCSNGKCETTESGTTECVCNPGFGKHPKGYCEACNCGEQFSCTFQDVWFMIQKTCLCPGNYKEVNGKCHDQCSLKPCQNGGTCKLTKDSFTCECPKEFTGKLCETEKCKCQNGKCIDSGKGLECVCNSDYGLFSPGVCKACNCGKGFTCTFKEDIFNFRYITYCKCPEGYSRLGPECIRNQIL